MELDQAAETSATAKPPAADDGEPATVHDSAPCQLEVTTMNEKKLTVKIIPVSVHFLD
jgi:hypothetical protein